MLEKISMLLAAIAASTAFAMMVSVQPRSIAHHASVSPTIVCWPDEDARTCWRRAEYRVGQ